MGFGSNKRTTINEDNRIINDYANAALDYSIRHETDSSINGEYAGNTGTLNVTDGGSFELTRIANENMASVANDGLSMAQMVSQHSMMLGADLADNGLATSVALSDKMMMLADGAIDKNSSLVDGITSMSGLMLDRTLSGAESLFLANSDSALDMQQDNNNTLENGFKSMMQFADSVSRSDGANLAESTNQTFMVLGVAGALAFLAYKRWG